MAITHLSGKFKLSQNRTEADRASVRDRLASSPLPLDREVAALMRKTR